MNAVNFLEHNKLTPESINMKTLVDHIINEMQRAERGEDSSLAMINSLLKPSFSIRGNQDVLVLDAGGTNFRTCLVHFNEDLSPVITNKTNSSMPGIRTEISADDFFEEIAERIEPLIEKTDRIGFCFSYPAKCLPSHDAVPLFFSKEIKAPGVIGKELGSNLFHHLELRGHNTKNKRIVILNDTVGTLLAGVPRMKERDADACIGFILGTGTNCAHIARGYVINEESGCLDFSVSPIDNAFLKTTKDPEKYKMEKMISGAYLGPLALFILKEAQKQGALSDSLTLPETLTSRDVSEFLNGNADVFFNASPIGAFPNETPVNRESLSAQAEKNAENTEKTADCGKSAVGTNVSEQSDSAESAETDKISSRFFISKQSDSARSAETDKISSRFFFSEQSDSAESAETGHIAENNQRTDLYPRSEDVNSSYKMSGATEKDISAIKEILSNIVSRSAKLSACMLAGAVLASDANKGETRSADVASKAEKTPRKVLINADGTTFYAVPNLKEQTESYLSDFLKEFNITAEFIKIEDSPIIGSAIAALCV